METNLHSCIRTGRTISEKTMEDGNNVNTKDEKTTTTSLTNLYGERPAKLTTNGHDFGGEHSSPPSEPGEQLRLPPDAAHDDSSRKRINPLRIHLGKRPFVDNSPQFYSSCKKPRTTVNKPSDRSAVVPRVPKLIPKRVDRSKFHNVASQRDSFMDNESDKPVPRLVPKSQLLQFKKGKAEKEPYLKEYVQNVSMQPMVKFKCRKCCSMSFKTLAMLKEHQLVCRGQTKEPTLTPETAPAAEPASGPSRVTRKVFLCSACGTYYENWNLFLHMREVHNRHICLFCLGMFSKAEKLSSHLIKKHNVKEFNYNSKEDFLSVYNGTLYLMCCACDEICSEQDDFFNHDCNNVKPKPVPVLISKNAVKPNVKQTKSSNELSTNCMTNVKEQAKPASDRKDLCEIKPETAVSDNHKTTPDAKDTESLNSDLLPESEQSTIIRTEDISNKDINAIDSGMELESSKSEPSPEQVAPSPISKDLPNGEDSMEHSDGNESLESDDLRIDEDPPNIQVPDYPPVEREKEEKCGIKLKLSLNNAKSPVIINSTVDPTVGQKHFHKPPGRNRRPPKRYEKVTSLEPVTQPRTPTIKMTICDKPDNPFVKTTIYENNQETTLLNNNLEIVPKTPEFKPDNSIKSTIYDNKIEDENSLNRVPKLTVRVPKELLDRDSSSDYSSDSDVGDKLTVDDNTAAVEDNTPKEEIIPETKPEEEASQPEAPMEDTPLPATVEEKVQTTDDLVEAKVETKTEPMEQDSAVAVDTTAPEEDLPPPADEVPVVEITLDKPIDKYPLKDLMRVFLPSTIYNCIYCNHVRKIAVNCEQLSLHMVTEHRFSAMVNSITAEELMPETITTKVKARAEEAKSVFINMDSYDSEEKTDEIPKYDNLFECFQCYFKTAIHKDLCFHNRKMHPKSMLLCVMCKTNFYSYSELLCHLCPGTYDSDYEIKFRCYLCNIDEIQSSFRLMVHLRKIHHTCEVCLEFCLNQARLSNHVWKHKLNHFCYRCGIAYRNKQDITNHLFWKHGTESVLCKRCLQKKWPHVYHFCAPPAIFVCDECSLQFTRAVSLKVHKRFHAGEFPHTCGEFECTEKFVSKKLLAKHLDDHRKKLMMEDLSDGKPPIIDITTEPKEPIPIIDLVNEKPTEEAGSSEIKAEAGTEQLSKKAKKKKLKDKDALLLDVNLPELNLSESDSSDESDSGGPPTTKKENPPEDEEEKTDEKPLVDEKPSISEIITETKIDNDTKLETGTKVETDTKPETAIEPKPEQLDPLLKIEEKPDIIQEEEKTSEQKALEIWDNFKKFQENQEKVEALEKPDKPKEKTPPLVPIRKHVCESDHDYCLIPTDYNGDEDPYSLDKKKSKKTPKKKRGGGGGGLSSSSSSSSDSDSSCSCGSNCSCSSSSGSSSSSSSDSDSSDESGNEKKKNKQLRKKISNRRVSNGSNVDVMGAAETPILIPEKLEPPIAESDLETEESETDEEFYDENPQKIANKLFEEKRNQLMLLASAAPSDGGSVSGETSRPTTPPPLAPEEKQEAVVKEKSSSSKKKSKKKKKSKSSRKHGPIKINIPKDVIAKSEVDSPYTQYAPTKLTISLQSNTVHIPETPTPAQVPVTSTNPSLSTPNTGNKRASKRRRVPNKFYGYSSDEDTAQSTVPAALKPQQPPKLEWRKEDLPSPVTHKTKKEIPSTILSSRYSYSDSIRLTAPIPDPEPPRILMNTESMESSDSDSSDEGGLEIYQPSHQAPPPIPPPSYITSGTSSLPYPFVRPPVRQAREGESVYCYCRCPYDEVSEMIACDAEGCPIEWFHFECVGIMVPPKGKWYCPECRKNQSFSGYR